jgi:hypothetical protein
MDTAPPDSETRKVMSQQLGPLLDFTESIHFVMEGSGFKNSILRSVTTNIILLAGKRGKISVYKSVDEAFAAMAPRLKELGMNAIALRQAAFNHGILRTTPGDAHPAM